MGNDIVIESRMLDDLHIYSHRTYQTYQGCCPEWLLVQQVHVQKTVEGGPHRGWHLHVSLISVVPHSDILLRTESATSCIQRTPSPSFPKATPKLKYSHVVGSTLWPCDPGKLSPDLSHVRSHNIPTTLRLCDIQARDPGKVSYDLSRDWLSMRSQVAIWSPDRMCFRHAPSPLIGMWKTMGMINKSTNQQTSHKTLEHSKVAHLLPVFVPALKYGPPVWVCMPALNMYAQTTLY